MVPNGHFCRVRYGTYELTSFLGLLLNFIYKHYAIPTRAANPAIFDFSAFFLDVNAIRKHKEDNHTHPKQPSLPEDSILDYWENMNNLD